MPGAGAARTSLVSATVEDAGRCFHCGLDNPVQSRWMARLEGAQRRFCCAGCLAVATTLGDAGLFSLYAARSTGGTAALAQGVPAAASAVRAALAGVRTFEPAPGQSAACLIVEGMTCGACVTLIERWLERQPGVVSARVDYATRELDLRWHTRTVTLEALASQLSHIGYRACAGDVQSRRDVARRERRDLLLRTGIALLSMMQVMMFSIPVYLSTEVTVAERALLDWAGLVMTLPALFYSAVPFFRGAWRDVAAGRVGMDVPVALGIAGAFAASLFATLSGSGEVYYDAVTMFIAWVLVARYAELVVRQRAARVLDALAPAAPPVAERCAGWPADVATQTVASDALAIGDHVLVRPGALVPADGEVVEGTAFVEEAMLTGESRPRRVEPGSRALMGSVSRDGALVIRVAAVGEGTELAAVMKLVERAARQRPGIAALADRIAGYFVAALLVAACVVGAGWAMHDPARVVPVLFALLVISCPCALSLATPAALVAATGALGRRGVLLARPDALERLGRVTHVVFDKTGTLTHGRPMLEHCDPLGDVSGAQATAIAAALLVRSEHPVARAFVPAAGAVAVVASQWTLHPGAGVAGQVDGIAYRLGSQAFVEGIAGALPSPAQGKLDTLPPDSQAIFLARADAHLALFALRDEPRAEAAQSVRKLDALGIFTLLRSGDASRSVGRLAAALGIGDAKRGCSPAGKEADVAALQAAGAVVAMVGDGINDAPALSRAQVSISLGEATVLARRQADIVVLGNHLDRIPEAIAHARRTRALIAQNLAWALAYNVIAIPAAAAGFVTPLTAAVGMSLSSLLVVANAQRAAWMRPRATS